MVFCGGKKPYQNVRNALQVFTNIVKEGSMNAVLTIKNIALP